jgi:hypothetical protein
VTYTVEIPNWRPVSLNAVRGRHWSAERRAKRETADLLAGYARFFLVPAAAGPRRVSVLVTLGPRERANDRDNLDKILLDALVQVGLLLDDGPASLDGRVEVTFRRGPARATTLTLEDVP